jgi:hypothetical protein
LPFETRFPREASEIWDETRRVRDEARLLRRGGWFPVLLFGIAELGSSPLYKIVLCGTTRRNGCQLHLIPSPVVGPSAISPVGGPSRWISLYWVVASACVFGITVAYYRHRGRVTGIRGRTRPMVETGAVLLAFVLMFGNWLHGWPFAVGRFGTEPLFIVGLSLLVLARTERSGTLAMIALVYVGVVFASLFYNYVNLFGRSRLNTPFHGEAALIPNVLIPGVYLIVASLVLRRSTRRRGYIRGESLE